MEASQSPSIEGALLWGLRKPPYRRAFAMETLQSPSIEGVSLTIGVCNALEALQSSLYRGALQSP